MDDFRSQRREVREGDRTIIREPGRTIIKEGNVTVIRRDESDRFRYGARNMIAERRDRGPARWLADHQRH
jgi:OmpA-OmpF porin, OOP family